MEELTTVFTPPVAVPLMTELLSAADEARRALGNLESLLAAVADEYRRAGLEIPAPAGAPAGAQKSKRKKKNEKDTFPPPSLPRTPSYSSLNQNKEEKERKDNIYSCRISKISQGLADAIRSRDANFRGNSQKNWETEIDRLHRIDGRSFDEIEAVLEFSQRDPFWQAVVLSGASLRRNFLKLVQAKAREECRYGTEKNRPAPVRRTEKEAELMRLIGEAYSEADRENLIEELKQLTGRT